MVPLAAQLPVPVPGAQPASALTVNTELLTSPSLQHLKVPGMRGCPALSLASSSGSTQCPTRSSGCCWYCHSCRALSTHKLTVVQQPWDRVQKMALVPAPAGPQPHLSGLTIPLCWVVTKIHATHLSSHSAWHGKELEVRVLGACPGAVHSDGHTNRHLPGLRYLPQVKSHGTRQRPSCGHGRGATSVSSLLCNAWS